MDLSDKPTRIRTGEELDTATLEQFLRDTIPDLDGDIHIRQFPSGHSNLTYLIRADNRELVLRRPPFGTKAKTAHDMGREYRILKALKPVYPYCPEPLAYTDDPAIMGCPFYVMERIRGIILRQNFPEGLDLAPPQVEQLCRRLLETQLELHMIDYHAVGLESLGKPAGYVERQVQGWNNRYRAARTPDAPDGERVMAWLADHMPPDTDHPGVVHNDFKFDNVVLDPQDPMRIIGVLDWEMATIGDPLMDLGCSLAYWIEPDDSDELQMIRMMPTNAKGALTRAQLVELYAERSGRRIDNFDFYRCFGLFKLAVIAQQIYYRYYHGQTRDERFKLMIYGVTVLEKEARRVAEASRL